MVRPHRVLKIKDCGDGERAAQLENAFPLEAPVTPSHTEIRHIQAVYYVPGLRVLQKRKAQ